jgi:hypothetical protein
MISKKMKTSVPKVLSLLSVLLLIGYFILTEGISVIYFMIIPTVILIVLILGMIMRKENKITINAQWAIFISTLIYVVSILLLSLIDADSVLKLGLAFFGIALVLVTYFISLVSLLFGLFKPNA